MEVTSDRIDVEADSRMVRAFVVCMVWDVRWRRDSEADNRTVRALVVPVLVEVDRAASGHLPAAVQSEFHIVTVTEPVSTGTTAPRRFVV